MAQATNMVLQEESGEDGGQYLDKSLSLHKIWAWLEDILSIRHQPVPQASMIQACQPLTRHLQRWVPARSSQFFGVCAQEGWISDARINGQQPGFWLIDSTSGGHTNAIACSFACSGPGLGELAAQAGSVPGHAVTDRQCLSAFFPGSGGEEPHH